MDEAEKEEVLRRARSILGSIKTEKKTAASRKTVKYAIEARTGAKLTEEHKARLRQAQAERRTRERAEREAITPPAPPRPRGRPKKVQEGQANG